MAQGPADCARSEVGLRKSRALAVAKSVEIAALLSAATGHRAVRGRRGTTVWLLIAFGFVGILFCGLAGLALAAWSEFEQQRLELIERNDSDA